MRLRTKYILFVVILHLVTLVLTYFIFKKDKPLFLLAEVFIIISLIISWNLYRQLIQPLKTMMDGLSAIKDQDFNVKFLATGKHEVDQLIGVYNQMIDKLRTERTRQEQQHFFLEKLIYTSPTGIIILDYDDRIQQINPRALEIVNLTEKDAIKEQIVSLDHEFFRHIAGLKTGETKTVKLNGTETYKIQRSHFVDRGFSRSFIMIEELTVEILAAEKNAYGKVIRMMAHEVNNTVGPVNSIIQSALQSKGLWKQGDELLAQALQVAFDRNQNLNHFMRNFADLVKLPPANKRPADLRQLIIEVIRLMELNAKENNIQLLLHCNEESFVVDMDVEQMEQALINIVKNAIEAIGSGGTVTFTVDTHLKELKIFDTGKGLSDEESTQIFNPFFSTKKDGQGIGLTLVREIMLNHGYEFSLKSSGQNTVFTIHLND